MPVTEVTPPFKPWAVFCQSASLSRGGNLSEMASAASVTRGDTGVGHTQLVTVSVFKTKRIKYSGEF